MGISTRRDAPQALLVVFGIPLDLYTRYVCHLQFFRYSKSFSAISLARLMVVLRLGLSLEHQKQASHDEGYSHDGAE
jgi:hypothetical protein